MPRNTAKSKSCASFLNNKILRKFTFNSVNLVSPALGIINSNIQHNSEELFTLNVTLKNISSAYKSKRNQPQL